LTPPGLTPFSWGQRRLIWQMMDDWLLYMPKYPKVKVTFTKLTVLMQLLDLLTTVYALKYLGFRELNPLLSSASIIQITVVKIVGIYMLVLLMTRLHYMIKPRTYKAVFYFSMTPVLWNTLNIIIEFI
jgi:hypothetical protein